MTTLFTNGALVPDAKQLRQLAVRCTAVEPVLVSVVRDKYADVVLEDDQVIVLDGLLAMLGMSLQITWVEQLGCEMWTGPIGSFINIDAMK